jgi:hypothetical protein
MESMLAAELVGAARSGNRPAYGFRFRSPANQRRAVLLQGVKREVVSRIAVSVWPLIVFALTLAYLKKNRN